MVNTLDDLRAAYPQIGFALYAYTPGGPVTLEVHAAEGVFTFRGATEAEAIAEAFPQEETFEDAEEAPTDIFG